jgi:hypothetical protein
MQFVVAIIGVVRRNAAGFKIESGGIFTLCQFLLTTALNVDF